MSQLQFLTFLESKTSFSSVRYGCSSYFKSLQANDDPLMVLTALLRFAIRKCIGKRVMCFVSPWYGKSPG